MFKSHKHRSHSHHNHSRDKFDFNFSDFLASKVPKGWDKLFVSLVSVETGKTIVKSGKASVRNGTCRWTETFSESVYFSHENGDSRELGGCLFRFVVAMGSSRSGILGEVTLDLSDYVSSRTSAPLSLQLNKCNYGTSLQFKVQCLTPKSKYRDARNKETNVDVEYGNSDHDDMETKSDASDSGYSRSIGSTSSSHLENASISKAVLSRDPSFSASDSRQSFDSTEASSGKDIFSPQNNSLGVPNIGRQDSNDSHNSRPSRSFPADGVQFQSDYSSFHSRVAESAMPYGDPREERNTSAFASSPLSNTGSSKDLLEAAEVTIEELRAEARMWARNSKKLTVDVEVLKSEVSEQSRSQKTLTMELSASQQECDDLKQEIEHVKGLLEESSSKHEATEDLRIQAKDLDEVQREMEEEIGILKNSNADLSEQLQKTQESNIELLSILQELESIVESQKLEIENLSSEKLKLEESVNLGPSNNVEFFDPDLEGSKVLNDPYPEGIDNIKLELQQLQETQEELESAIRLLEQTVEEKDDEIKREQELRVQSLLDCESSWGLKVAAKEEELKNLKAKLTVCEKVHQNLDVEAETGSKTQLVEEVELLRRKVKDLEKDCSELTEENLELLLKLKEPMKDALSADYTPITSSCGCSDSNCPCTCESELRHLRIQLQKLQQEQSSKVIEEATVLTQSQDLEKESGEIQSQSEKEKTIFLEVELQKFHVQVEEQQNQIYELQQQLKQLEGSETITGELLSVAANCIQEHDREGQQRNQEQGNLNKCANCSSSQGTEKSETFVYSDISKRVDLGALEVANSHSLRKEEEIETLQTRISMLENQIATIRNENLLLEETVKNLESEKNISFESIEDLKKEIMELSSSVESHVSASKILERMSSELGKGKQDVEQQLSDLEKENMQLSERIPALEAQLRYLTNEKETCYLELQHSETQSTNLRDEIRRLETEMEAQRADMKLKLQDMRSRWMEAQEECEYLKKANPKLQSTAENLIDECNSLQKFNGELKRQNTDLRTRCTVLESELKDTQRKFFECSQKIEALDAEFNIMMEEILLKEKSLKSEFDSILVVDKEHREKLMQENISLNDMYLRKAVEVENLQRELVHLIDQISVAHNEKETVNSEVLLELSVLRADKAKLEVAIEELQGKLTLCQSKLTTLASDSEVKTLELTRELTASRKNEEALIADRDKLSALLEGVRRSNENYKSIVIGLDINHKASEYERRQLAEEISTLKEQIHRASLLQDELLDLKISLSEAKFEYEKVKASLDLLHGDHEELKTEKDSLVQKISGMETALSELEDCKHGKIALQEKVLRLEGDLATREALCAQDAELKFELSRVRRANNELQRKIKHLEQDQEGYLNRIQALEEKLKQKVSTMPDLMKSAGNPFALDDPALHVVPSTSNGKQPIRINGSQNTDYLLKIESLENELAEALEANDMYKSQLRRSLSGEHNKYSDTQNLSEGDNRSDRRMNANVLSLEIELKDLRERYSQMSLKYAEVEAQREELVLKLKSTNNRRSWFS